MVAALVLLLAITKPTNFGDTKWYARNLLAHQRGDFHVDGSRLWEFGHLIERPIGYMVYRAVRPAARALLPWSDYLIARTSLVAISLVCAFGLAWLFQSIARQVGLEPMPAFLVAIGAFCLNGTLIFATSGTAYIPGLLFLTWALLVALSAAARGPASAVYAGIALAFSVAFWFPNALSVPPVLLAGLCWARSDWNWKSSESLARLRWCTMSLVVCGCAVFLIYGIGVLALGIHSVAALREWFGGSTHGWQQNRNLLRLVSGMPRGFVGMESGMALKRYVLHDPYAHVTRSDLVRLGAWKLLLFYAAAACLAGKLILSRRGRIALALCAAGVAPVIAFAVYFEAGSVERYLAMFPFLVLALSVAYTEPGGTWTTRGLTVLLISIGVANVVAMWRPAVTKDWSPELDRMQVLRSTTKPTDLIWLLPNDRLFLLPEVFPYDDLNRPGELKMEEIATLANEALPRWRKYFASRTLGVWQRGGQIWMAKRLSSDTPRPEWGWSEGDDPRITWNQLSAFARNLDVAESDGGDDGFVRLADTPEARRTLQALCPQSSDGVTCP